MQLSKFVLPSDVQVPYEEWMDKVPYAYECYEWCKIEEAARINTHNRIVSDADKILIAVKAQHPLTKEGFPGPEYEMRLSKALEILEDDQEYGEFLLFGGVHDQSGITLADAGAQWLMEQGISEKIIHRFPVVFSGNDEDRIAAEYFRDHPEFYQIHVVLSVGQIPRTWMYYLSMGYQPALDPVTFTEAQPNHSFVKELWGPWALPTFAAGPDAIAEATEKIRQKHLDAAASTPTV